MKKLLLFLCLASAGLLAGAGLVEVLIRIFFPQSAVLHRLDPVYGYRGIPNKSGRYISAYGEYRVLLRMNSLGFRDVEHPMEKPPGVYRILFLGDSFTEAKEVELEQTYWRRLQAALPEMPDGRRVEAVNMAISGYGTGQQFLVLQNIGLAWKPDLVVLAMTDFTDVWNNSRYLDCLSDGRDPEYPMKPYFDPTSGTLQIHPFTVHDMDQGPLGFFRRNFQTYMYLRNLTVANPGLMRLAWKLGFVRTPPAPAEVSPRHPVYLDLYRPDLEADTHWVDAWSLTRRLILEIDRACREAGSEFLLMRIPYVPQIYESRREDLARRYPDIRSLSMDWDRPGKVLTPFIAEHGIPHLDLFPPFQQAATVRPEESLYFYHDHHLSPEGHRVVAESLKEVLRAPAIRGNGATE